MKRKIKVTLNGKTTEGEVEVRNTLHLEVQKKTRANVFKPKKGKGSFKRNKKVEED